MSALHAHPSCPTVETTGDGGVGPTALFLPALSSVAASEEMRPLADRLAPRFDRRLVDWPGFGALAEGPLSPALLDRFLDRLTGDLAPEPVIGVAAGHGATYLVRAARRHPGRFGSLVLVAPTWRGPLPTMTRGKRPAFCRQVRAALEHPLTGPGFYRLNMSRPIIGWMMREHVYGDATRVTPGLVSAKQGIATGPGRRFATAAFVSGALDPAASRAAFLSLFEGPLPPMLMLRPRNAPQRSGAEMDALAETGRVSTAWVDGALAPHEEHPDAVAAAILDWLGVEAYRFS